jgi:hypothetical protein
MEQLSNRQTLARALRAEVFLLCGSKCCMCSATTDLQIHVKFDDYGAHHNLGSDRRWRFYLCCVKLSLAVMVCRSCHRRLTNGQRQERASARVLRETLLRARPLLDSTSL